MRTKSRSRKNIDSSGNPQYIYERIEGKTEIRLFVLDPGLRDQPIVGSLVLYDLNDTGKVTSWNPLGEAGYTALSYVWGGVEESFEIVLRAGSSQFCLSIGRNLHDFLKHYRSPVNSQRLWIDAVCINQSDHSERGAQVQLMERIYKEADIVCVWLGCETNERVPILEQLIKQAASESFVMQNADDDNTNVKEGLAPLAISRKGTTRSSLWQRIFDLSEHRGWMFQELSLAQRLQLRVGYSIFDVNLAGFNWDAVYKSAESEGSPKPVESAIQDAFLDYSVGTPPSIGSQSVFSDDTTRTLSTQATTIGHAPGLVLQELVSFLVYDQELSITYEKLRKSGDWRALHAKLQTFLKVFAIELSDELEEELVMIPTFIREQRNRLSRRVCEQLKPNSEKFPQELLAQDIDKAKTLNDYFTSILGGKQSLKQSEAQQNATASSPDSDGTSESDTADPVKFNMTEKIKSRLLETQALKSFRANFDTWVNAHVVKHGQAKGAPKLREIVNKHIILPQRVLLAWKRASRSTQLHRLTGANRLREIVIQRVILPQRVLRKWRRSMPVTIGSRLAGASKLRDIIRRKIIVPQRVIGNWRRSESFVKQNSSRGARRLRNLILKEIIMPLRILSKWSSSKRPTKRLNARGARRLRQIVSKRIILPRRILSKWRTSSRLRVAQLEIETNCRGEELQWYLKFMISKTAFVPFSHIREVSLIENEPVLAIESYQSALQAYTKSEWNWWPMIRLRRTQGENLHDQVVKWQCCCNHSHYTNIAKGKVVINKILQGAIIHTTPTNPRAGKPQSLSVVQSRQQSSQSTIASTNQPTSIPLGNVIPSAVPVTTLGAPSNLQSLQMPGSEHVLLAVRRGNDLDLVQIRKDSCSNDGDFFAQLKKSYLSKRGLWRRVLGLRIYDHCEFVEFEKPLYKIIFRRQKGYPHDVPSRLPLYRYRPIKTVDPEWHDPPIMVDEFYRRFHGSGNCMTKTLNLFHICSHFCPTTIDCLDRIPKIISSFELETQGRDQAWGLQAVESISGLRVLVYHIMILAGPVVFWALWLWYWDYKADLQNASVPFTCILGALSLFWAIIKG